MSEPQLPREVRRRLAIIHHAEEVTGNVAMTCRYYGISRQVYYRWLRRYQEQGIDGLRDLSRRPHHSPNATHVDVVGKILYLRQNYHFGPAKIAMCWDGRWRARTSQGATRAFAVRRRPPGRGFAR
jgi:transposase